MALIHLSWKQLRRYELISFFRHFTGTRDLQMYSCQCFIRSPPQDSQSAGSSRFVISNLCFRSQENSVKDGKEEQWNSLVSTWHGLVYQIITHLSIAKCLFNICCSRRWKKHLGTFSKASIWDCNGMQFYGLYCVSYVRKNLYHWYL